MLPGMTERKSQVVSNIRSVAQNPWADPERAPGAIAIAQRATSALSSVARSRRILRTVCWPCLLTECMQKVVEITELHPFTAARSCDVEILIDKVSPLSALFGDLTMINENSRRHANARIERPHGLREGRGHAIHFNRDRNSLS